MKIYVVIPVRDNLPLTKSICYQLIDKQIGWDYTLIFDNGSTDGTQEFLRDLTYTDPRFFPYWTPEMNIYEMWSTGFEYARADGADAVAFLNNDIEMPANLIHRMGRLLEDYERVGIVYPNYNRECADGVVADSTIRYTHGTYRHGGMSGFCFMVRTSAVDWDPLVDPGYKIWYGDDEIAFSMKKAGYHQVRLEGWPVDHIGQATANKFPKVFEYVGSDREHFESRWGKGK